MSSNMPGSHRFNLLVAAILTSMLAAVGCSQNVVTESGFEIPVSDPSRQLASESGSPQPSDQSSSVENVSQNPANASELGSATGEKATADNRTTNSVETPAPEQLPSKSESTPPQPSPSRNFKPVRGGKDDGPVAITFDDLNLNMQADIVFRPWMLSERVKELEGKRVKLSGYIYAGLAQTKRIKEFVLLRNTECKFGPGGQADHLIQVSMQESNSANYTNQPVEVDGVLSTAPYEGPDGNTWAVFRLDGLRVVAK